MKSLNTRSSALAIALLLIFAVGLVAGAGITLSSAHVAAQEPTLPEPPSTEPVVALPIDGALVMEPAMVDPAVADAALGTAITYQGVLRSGNAPANGTFDFQFQLFNAATAGTQRGATLLADNVAVTLGRFTTALDFGNVFGDEALWLAVGVRSGTSTDAFTVLAPRQSVTPAPFARYAATAGNAAALQSEVNTLKTQVAALQTLLAGVTREDDGKTIRVTGANFQVVNGTGATDGGENGLGNVIIGYNEPHPTLGNSKSGSHYLVVGKGNAYELHGGIVAGENNSVYGWYSSALGGKDNFIDADHATIVGGQGGKVWNSYSVVIGGVGQSVTGHHSAVVGGEFNEISGNYSVVVGGGANLASSNYSVVVGGGENIAQHRLVTMAGGFSNESNAASRIFGNNYVTFVDEFP